MKKGRPGLRIEALTTAQAAGAVIDALFRTTTTIGVRQWPVARAALPRTERTVEFRGQTIRVKEVVLPGGTLRRKPEYEDVVRAARALGLTPLEVRTAVDRPDPGREGGRE